MIMPDLQAYSSSLYFIWREVCHIVGSVALIVVSYVLSVWIGHDVKPIIFVALLVWMTYQEFVLHPRKYGQKLSKGIIDWLAWVAPFAIYLAMV